MADTESSISSLDDKSNKNDGVLLDVAKGQNKPSSPPSLEPCANATDEDIRIDGDANGEMFTEMPVITHLAECSDENSKELENRENTETASAADCSESYQNCDEDGDCQNPAEICESTMIEGPTNESWITGVSTEDGSGSSENSNIEMKQPNSFEIDSVKAIDVKDKSGDTVISEEVSPCLLAISDVRQNEPWLSDDSESNLCKLPSKEEHVASEVKGSSETEIEKSQIQLEAANTKNFSDDCENEENTVSRDAISPLCDSSRNSPKIEKMKDAKVNSPNNNDYGQESPENIPCSPHEAKVKQEDELVIKIENNEKDGACGSRNSTECSDEIKDVKLDGESSKQELLKDETIDVKKEREPTNEIEMLDVKKEDKSDPDIMEVDEVKDAKHEKDCTTGSNAEEKIDHSAVENIDNAGEKSNITAEEKVETSKLKEENSELHEEPKQGESKETSEKPSEENKGNMSVNITSVDQKKEEDKKTDGDKKKQSEAEMKGYITDTMNELLGLFGYEQVDDNLKDNLELEKISSSISGTNTTPTASSSAKNADVNKKDRRTCAECNAVKGLKYQVVFQGKTKFLCSDSCFSIFRGKQRLASAPSVSSESTAELCAQCKKEIKNGQGYFPTGENKPLCSEECMQKYQQAHEPKQVCTQCKNNIEGRTKCLTWETMEFCSEDCLGKYQTFLGSHCTCCQSAVQRASLGKYCVRFGFDIRQFCSGRCLEEFKKGLKVCSFCQKDLSSGQDGFLAPVGDKGYFKDFCSQLCMERYEAMNNTTSPPPMQQCSVCNKLAPVKVQVKYEGKSHPLCSEPCIAAFRYANKINTTICDTCHKFFDSKTTQFFNLQFEGTCKRFCNKGCMNLFVLSHRKIVPCTWCKVKKYNFDMIERVDSSNHVQLFCSLNCLSLFRVSLNATSSRSVRCDHCQQFQPAQYHLTMSDASIRNFCCYQCVINFQNQFTHVPTLTTATPSVRHATPNASTTGKTTTTTPTPTPIISSVMSLAPAQGTKQPTLQQPAKPSLQPPPKPSSTNRSQPPPPPPLTSIVTKSQPTLIGNPPTVTVASTGSPQVIREVIVRPPAPKMLKNKALLCKPIMQTKGISCRPNPCHKAVQTDLDEEIVPTKPDLDEEIVPTKPVIIPVPLPIFVPAPLHMFSRPVPTPVPFPLPIPVPVFIPTTKSSSSQILKHIKEIQEKIPTNPFEADLLMMAEMVAADGQKESFGEACGADTDMLPSTPEKNFCGIPETDASNQEDISPLQETRSRGRGYKRSRGRYGGRGRGRKRLRVDDDRPVMKEEIKEESPDASASNETVNESEMCLKCSFGVNAWKHWVLEKNSQLEKGSQSLRKLKLFKTDLLQLSPDELNYSLCLFVKEVRKPSGEEYAPDSIYYLCLGIQQYLFENGRIDNIFTDPYYEKFTECLNEVLHRQEILRNEAALVSRIEEEILWDAKQLGAHSPHVLLNTLMYFNTKQFFLKTIEDHMQLSFTHIMKHWKKTTLKDTVVRTVMLRYYPPLNNKDSKKRRDEQTVYEQLENVDNPLRCPVKLYEFYLSKCPESVRSRSDVFYLYPERSCVPDSPVWYSTQPLGRETVAKMLQRIKMVREINEMEEDQKG